MHKQETGEEADQFINWSKVVSFNSTKAWIRGLMEVHYLQGVMSGRNQGTTGKLT